MRSKHAGVLVLMVICITLVFSVSTLADTTLTTWTMPYGNAFPSGLAIDEQGRIYTAAAGGREVYRLDPVNELFRSWGVGDRPQDVVIVDGVVFCTIRDGDYVVYFDPDGVGVYTVDVPFAGVGPQTIRRGVDTDDGKVVLWISEWNVSGVLHYEYDPVVDAPVPVGMPSDGSAVSITADMTPTLLTAEYEQYEYIVDLIPDPEPIAAQTTSGAFTEWALPMDTPPGIADFAVTENGTLWISCSLPFLYRLDSAAGTLQLLETIQNVVISSGLLPASDGGIWFGNLLEGAIGHFDPVVGTSEVWRIPGTGEVYDLAFGPDGTIWYTDRVADAIGCLDTVSNQATVYPLTVNCEPLELAFDADGSLWFVAGSGNFVGRLTMPEEP